MAKVQRYEIAPKYKHCFNSTTRLFSILVIIIRGRVDGASAIETVDQDRLPIESNQKL